jgi:hypothetical protein
MKYVDKILTSSQTLNSPIGISHEIHPAVPGQYLAGATDNKFIVTLLA